MSSLLHLASGPAAADVVRTALHRLERVEEVLNAANDCLSAGPLVDVDEGAASRADWWARVRGRHLDKHEAAGLDDRDVWARAQNDARTVVLWHGPHPVDRMFVLRACWWLRTQPMRVHEVALTGRVRQMLPRFYDAIAIAGPDALVAEWTRRASVQDVLGRADEWERQRAEPGDWLRELRGEEIVRLPMDAYDGALIAACQKAWTNSIRVIGTVLAENPTSDLVLAWRLRELLNRGALMGRGPSNRAGLPEELLLSPASDSG